MERKVLKRSDTNSIRWRKKQLRSCRLYCILDINKSPSQIAAFARKIVTAGVDIIQLREKAGNYKKLLDVARALNAKLKHASVLIIVNDRPDIARLSSLDGVHLGQRDISIKDARKILGTEKIIGISCHSLKQAREAEGQGADYISIGPIYPTPTKKDEPAIGLSSLSLVSKAVKIPFFTIGGINSSNLAKIKRYGAGRVAVYRDIVKAKNPLENTARLKQMLL